jgi:Methylase involved in ubiquinone/menaquinone biosynthesis
MGDQAWDPIAEAYAELGDARLHTVFPHAIEVLRRKGVQRVLDYGGGPGLFIERWRQQGGGGATHFDPSPEMRAQAARRLSGAVAKGEVEIVTETTSLPAGAFDAVTFHAVWMCLPTPDECVAVLREIRRLLRAGGVLLASVTHPCFRDRAFSTFRPALAMEEYLNEGAPFKVVMQDGARTVEFTDYHYSLGEHVRQLGASGFAIAALHEYADHPREAQPRAYPWLMFEAVKPG